MTGCTVQRIVAEKSALSGAVFVSPTKHNKQDWKRVSPDDFEMEVLQRVVHDFHRDNKYPTMDSLLTAAKEKSIYSGEHTTLWRILHKMSFKHIICGVCMCATTQLISIPSLSVFHPTLTHLAAMFVCLWMDTTFHISYFHRPPCPYPWGHIPSLYPHTLFTGKV